MSDCVHVVPYLTGYDCERCGATPEQMSPDPGRFRSEIDQARVWVANSHPDLAVIGLPMTLMPVGAVGER